MAKWVRMVSPDGSVVKDVREDTVQSAVDQEWQIETPEQAKLREYQTKEGSSVAESLKAVGEHAAGTLSFGGSDVLLSQIPGYNEQRRMRDETYPISGGVGTVGSALVPLLGQASKLGTVAKAVSAPLTAVSRGSAALGRSVEGVLAGSAPSIGRRLLAKTAGGAVAGATEGAAIGAGQALTESSIQDKALTAELLLARMGESASVGGVLGGGLGATGQLFGLAGKGVKGAAKFVPGVGEIIGADAQSLANSKALAALGFQRSDMKRIIKKFGPDAVNEMGAEAQRILEIGSPGAWGRAARYDLAEGAERVAVVKSELRTKLDDAYAFLKSEGAKDRVDALVSRVDDEILGPLRNSLSGDDARILRAIESEIKPLRRQLIEAERRAGTAKGVQGIKERIAALKSIADEVSDNTVSQPSFTKKLFRASDDDYVSDGFSFAESTGVAKQYQNNPGFGGKNLYEYGISASDDEVLDLTGFSAKKAAKRLGLDDPGAIGVDEWIPRSESALATAREKGFKFIKVSESFPEDSTTWIWTGLGSEPESLALRLSDSANYAASVAKVKALAVDVKKEIDVLVPAFQKIGANESVNRLKNLSSSVGKISKSDGQNIYPQLEKVRDAYNLLDDSVARTVVDKASPTIDIGELWGLAKKQTEKIKNFTVNRDPKETAYRKYWAILKDSIDEQANKSGIGQDLRDLNQRLKRVIALDEVASQSASFAGNRSVSLTDTISGVGGAGMGAGVGGPIGAAVGGLVGGTVNRFMRSAAGDELLAVAANRYASLRRAVDTADSAASTISRELKSALKVVPAKQRAVGIASRLASEFEGQRQLVIARNAEQDKLLAELNVRTAEASDAAPELSGAITETAARGSALLTAEMPQALETGDVRDRVSTPDIPESEKSAWLRKLGVLREPTSVIKSMRDGELTAEQVDVLRKAYPALYGKMQAELIRHVEQNAIDGNVPAYEQRAMASVFTGTPVDATYDPKMIRAFQRKHQERKNRTQPAPMPRPSLARASDIANRKFSPVDRREV